jgi:hypothetical protein
MYEPTEVSDVSSECMEDALYEKYAPFDIGCDTVLDAEKAIITHLGWLFHGTDHSIDGLVRIKLEDLGTICGVKMQKVVDGKVVEGEPGYHPIYVKLVFTYVLFHAGIVCDMGELEDKQPVITLRRRVDGDVLPSIFCEE